MKDAYAVCGSGTSSKAWSSQDSWDTIAGNRQEKNRYFIDKYESALAHLPPSGGNGCHTALLSISNFGILAKIPEERIFQDLRAAIHGTRRVPDREIREAITRASQDLGSGRPYYSLPPVKPIVRNGKAVLQRIIDRGRGYTEGDIFESSPIRLSDDVSQDYKLLLSHLYDPDDLIFIGRRNDKGIVGQTIRTPSQWIDHFSNHPTKEHIIINPLSGREEPKENGDGTTYRGNRCVSKFKYCLVEFDELSFQDQLAFWCSVKLPVCALIFSGGKSIHGWIDVQKYKGHSINTLNDWKLEIENKFYIELLQPLGVDSACKNPARLSRLPGHYRRSKDRWQKLLWLSGSGGGVISHG